MNANQIINMIIRQLTRRAINKGINVGMDKAAKVGAKAKQKAQPVSEYEMPQSRDQNDTRLADSPVSETRGDVKHVQKMAQVLRR